MKDLFIFGTSDAAELAQFYFSKEKKYKVAGFVVDREFKQTDRFCGLPVIDSTELLENYPPNKFTAFIAIGYSGLNAVRKTQYQRLKEKGYNFATYISPQAICLTEDIGENCLIQEGCIIQPFVKIGNNVVIWSGAHIGHHSIVADHCFIAPRAALSGRVVLKEGSFVGINATIKDHVTISKGNLIAAGALVVETTLDDMLQKNSKSVGSKLTKETIKKI